MRACLEGRGGSKLWPASCFETHRGAVSSVEEASICRAAILLSMRPSANTDQRAVAHPTCSLRRHPPRFCHRAHLVGAIFALWDLRERDETPNCDLVRR